MNETYLFELEKQLVRTRAAIDRYLLEKQDFYNRLKTPSTYASLKQRVEIAEKNLEEQRKILRGML